MKKLFLTAAVIFVFGFFGSFVFAATNAYAYSDADLSDIKTFSAENTYTVITDTENVMHRLDGVIDADALESSDAVLKLASYTVFVGGTELMNVKLTDMIPQSESKDGADGSAVLASGTAMPNGYYSIKFTLSEEENTECFLTGLSGANLSEVQTKLLNAVLENSQFTMESLDFIDAEKTGVTGHGDSWLCWAAVASNMLRYTGWAAKAEEKNPGISLGSEDDLLDLFNSEFYDNGGEEIYAFQWFFDGTSQSQKTDSGSVRIKNYGKSGGYLKEYSYDQVIEYVEAYKDRAGATEAISELQNGSAIGINIEYVGYSMGHALTLWGYVCDKDYADTDAEYLTEFIFSDSDSDQQSDENRRTAPNKLRVINISPYTDNSYDTWCLDGYDSVDCALIEVTRLKPYSDDLEYETDPDATLDMFNDCDFSIYDIDISSDADLSDNFDTVSEGDNVYIRSRVSNISDVEYEGSVKYTVTVTDKDGNVELEKTYNEEIAVKPYDDRLLTAEATGLSAGDHIVTVKLDPDKEITEAHYYNNKYSTFLSVVEKKIDTSDMSVSANIGDFSQGGTNAEISCSGLDTAAGQYRSPSYTLYVSYYENGKWSSFAEADELKEESSGSPIGCRVSARGEKVRFKLLINEGDDAEKVETPPIIISSDEYDLKYTKLSPEASAANTGTYTPLDKNSSALTDGEVFAFNVKNTSTYDASVSGTAKVYAVSGSEKILLYSEDVTLEYGGAEEIGFSSWDTKDTQFSGTYTVSAEIELDGVTSSLTLGTLAFKDTPSLVVTSSADTVDEYDGVTTLREAITYASDGDEITFAFEGGSTYVITLTEPLTIDKRITIAGSKDRIDILYGSGSIRLFRITENGDLTLKDVVLHSGYSMDNGGAVENDGGTAVLTDCIFYGCKSGSAGGAIYTNGGSVMLKGCTLRENSSGYGGAICVSGGARLDMLCCNLFNNSSNGGAIYNNGSEAYIIYSTLFKNTAKYSGGGAVTSEGDTARTAIVGCIASLNGDTDIGGKAALCGSYYSAADADAAADEYSVCGDGQRIFVCDTSGDVKYYHPTNSAIYNVYTSPLAETGVYVKNDGGNLSYSSDGSTWVSTDITSKFTDEEYKLDINGTLHEAMFGASLNVKNEVMIVSADGIFVAVYSPEKSSAVLIAGNQNDDGTISDVSFRDTELDIGTNIIVMPVSGAAELMLWSSLGDMMPLCEAYEYTGKQ